MASQYYRPCPELTECDRLIKTYYLTGQYEACFRGHLPLAEAGYPLAECQIGFFYYEGLGVERDLERSFYWTRRGAEHGDWDAQFNLAEWFYGPGQVADGDPDQAARWYAAAARQGHKEALAKCRELGISLQ